MKNCIPHNYIVFDKVLVHHKNPLKGPCPITKVWKNRTVAMHRGAIKYHINVRWIKPYHEQ